MIAALATDAIDITAVAGQPLNIAHGLGRPVLGWIVIWSDAPLSLHVQDATADSKDSLVLVPSASAKAKLVLL